MQFSPACCYFLYYRPKNSPQHHQFCMSKGLWPSFAVCLGTELRKRIKFDKLLYLLGCNGKNYIKTAHNLNTSLYNISQNYRMLRSFHTCGSSDMVFNKRVNYVVKLWFGRNFILSSSVITAKNVLIHIRINFQCVYMYTKIKINIKIPWFRSWTSISFKKLQ
jgi:hypothetical protein